MDKGKNIAFVVHSGRKEARACAAQAEAFLKRAGYRVTYPRDGARQDVYSMVITFGGDGTLLLGAGEAIACGCPLLGINLGTVGFLTEGEPKNLLSLMTRVLEGDYQTESRGLLRISVNEETESVLALNDAVITRGGFARLIQVDTFVGDEQWDTFTADGIIAATPTGSTGYSLSAGGPVLAPGVEGIVITPVCAHSLRHCPCVVPAASRIRFQLKPEREQRGELQIDGRSRRMLNAGDTVHVTGAGQELKLVRMGDYRFFEVMRRKFLAWSQPEERGAGA